MASCTFSSATEKSRMMIAACFICDCVQPAISPPRKMADTSRAKTLQAPARPARCGEAEVRHIPRRTLDGRPAILSHRFDAGAYPLRGSEDVFEAAGDYYRGARRFCQAANLRGCF